MTYIYGTRIERFIPCWIEPAHATGKIRPVPILRLNIVRVLRNAIIDPIECFDEFLKSGEHGALPSKESRESTLYSFNQRLSTFGSSRPSCNWLEMISRPKCL